MIDTRVKVVLTGQTVRLLTRFGDEARPVVLTAMELTMQGAEVETAKHTPVDRGLLKLSVTGQAVDFWPKVIGLLGSLVPYAEPVEYGSRPHWPPLAPLELWVRRKLGVPAAQVKSVAYLVARKISRVGTQGYHMFRVGTVYAERVAPRLIERGLRNLERSLSDR